MTDLQIGMIALGVVAVLGVLAYNKWQERQHQKMADQMLQKPDSDVLLDSSPQSVQGGAPVFADRREPGMQDFQTAAAEEGGVEDAESVPEGQDVRVPPDLLTEDIDAIAVFELVEPVGAAHLLDFHREALATIQKPIRWIGFNRETRKWELIVPGIEAHYHCIRVGLQMVDRQGPVSAGDYELFSTEIGRLAHDLMAVANLPSRQQVLDHAARLDLFCADVDMQIGVNVLSPGHVFTGTQIHAQAEENGLVLVEEGVYHAYDEHHSLQFVLQNYEANAFTAEGMATLSTHALVFLLDVPRVAQGEAAYAAMIGAAKRFAISLGGSLVDDNRQALSDLQLNQILQAYVIKPQLEMDNRGIPAGSQLAQRLFA